MACETGPFIATPPEIIDTGTPPTPLAVALIIAGLVPVYIPPSDIVVGELLAPIEPAKIETGTPPEGVPPMFPVRCT